MTTNNVVFTPSKYARFMAEQGLEMWQISTGRQMKQARILDPACGTGNLLYACREYIYELYLDYPQNIIGIDIREDFLNEARQRIPEGTFYKLDALLEVEKLGKFDFIIANPPYTSVNCISENIRKQYKEKYQTYYGRADLYILFVELGWRLLNENGVMAFLIPEVWLKSQNGTVLRKLFETEKPDLYIVRPTEKIFKKQVFTHFIFAVKRKSNSIKYAEVQL